MSEDEKSQPPYQHLVEDLESESPFAQFDAMIVELKKFVAREEDDE